MACGLFAANASVGLCPGHPLCGVARISHVRVAVGTGRDRSSETCELILA